MVLVVFKKTFSIAVVVLKEQELVLGAAESEGQFDDCVVVEHIPSLAFDEDYAPAPSPVVAEYRCPYLIYAAVS